MSRLQRARVQEVICGQIFSLTIHATKKQQKMLASLGMVIGFLDPLPLDNPLPLQFSKSGHSIHIYRCRNSGLQLHISAPMGGTHSCNSGRPQL